MAGEVLLVIAFGVVVLLFLVSVVVWAKECIDEWSFWHKRKP